jgi:putative oxidoreductase
MKIISLIARILLGLCFLVFGLNKLHTFIPASAMPALTPAAISFYMALMSEHLIQIIAILEIISGILLLANRFVALALTLLGPIVVNIFIFHSVLAPAGLPVAAIVVVLYVIVMRHHKAAFDPILRMKS